MNGIRYNLKQCMNLKGQQETNTTYNFITFIAHVY